MFKRKYRFNYWNDGTVYKEITLSGKRVVNMKKEKGKLPMGSKISKHPMFFCINGDEAFAIPKNIPLELEQWMSSISNTCKDYGFTIDINDKIIRRISVFQQI